jgi:hypothetical protein
MPGLKPGVYVKAKDSQRTKEAHCAPVGELALFKNHKTAITEVSNKSLVFWRLAFDDLMRLESADEGKDCLDGIPGRLSRKAGVSDPSSVATNSDEISDSKDEPFNEDIPSQIQTTHPIPGGIDDRPLALQEAEAFVAEVPQDPRLQEDVFLKFLVKAGPAYDATMPAYCQIPHFAIQGYRAAKNLVEVSNELHHKSNQLGLQLQEKVTVVSSLNKSNNQISKPARCGVKEKHVWKVLEELSREISILKSKETEVSDELSKARQTIKDLESENSAIEDKFDGELDKMNKGFIAFETHVAEKLQDLYERVGESSTVPSQSVTPSPAFNSEAFSSEAKEYFINRMDSLEGRLNKAINSPSASPSSEIATEFEAWKSQVEVLGEKVNKTNSEVLSMQLKNDTTGVSYTFGNYVFRSVVCVNQFFAGHSSNVEPGVFADFMVILEDIYSVGDHNYDPVQSLKQKQISSNLGLSEATTNLICVNDLRSPQLLNGKKSGTTTCIKFADWRNKSIIESGVAIDIATHLPEIKRRFEKSIELQFYGADEEDEKWRILAVDMLGVAVDLVKQLAQYIDDMMRTLVDGGGNEPEEAWRIVMKAVTRIFDEYFAPVRRMPLNAIPKEDQNPSARRMLFSRLIWNSIQTFVLTKELLKTDIRHHHVVASAYTDWAIINSGKPEAIKAKEATVKMAADIKELTSSVAAVKKSVGEATATAKEAKKNADKAIAKAK